MRITQSDFEQITSMYWNKAREYDDIHRNGDVDPKTFLDAKVEAYKAKENPTRDDALDLLADYAMMETIFGARQFGEDQAEEKEAYLDAMQEVQESIGKALNLDPGYVVYVGDSAMGNEYRMKLPETEEEEFDPIEAYNSILMARKIELDERNNPSPSAEELEEEQRRMDEELKESRREAVTEELQVERTHAIDEKIEALHSGDKKIDSVGKNMVLDNVLFMNVYEAREKESHIYASSLEESFNARNAERDTIKRDAAQIDDAIANGTYAKSQEQTVAEQSARYEAKTICAGKIAAYTKLQEVRGGRSGWDKFWHPVRTFQEWRASKRMEADLKENYNLTPDNLKKIADVTATRGKTQLAGFMDRNNNETLNRFPLDGEIDARYEAKFGKENDAQKGDAELDFGMEEKQLDELLKEFNPENMKELNGDNLSQPVNQQNVNLQKENVMSND